jgi:thiamine biosynthesis lipoprotein
LRSLIITVITVVLATASILLLVFFTRNGASSDEYRSPTLFAMDTTMDITIHERDDELAEDDVKAAFELVEKIESYTSRFTEGSDVWEINREAGTAPVKVHRETLEMVQRSVDFAELTGGAFDITVAPISELWGFYDQDYRVPSQAEIDSTRNLVGYQRIIVDADDGTVMLADEGMAIDLGAVAKGYAVGAVCELLKERGVKSGLVNFGGTVGAIGVRSDGKDWVVGIRSPRGEATDLIGELEASNAFVSSSGDYERFFEENGIRYCHIFDPRTGRQPTGAMSVTVVGPDAMNADILSTALLVMGPEKGFELLEGFSGYDASIIDNNGNVELSKDMDDHLIRIQEHI